MTRVFWLLLAATLLLARPSQAQLTVNNPPPPVPGADCAGGASVTGWPSYGALFAAHCGTGVSTGTINLGTVGLPAEYTGTGTLSNFTPGGDVTFATPNYSVISARGGNITIPNVTDTVALLAAAQTLTTKTINCANNICTVRANLDLTGFLAAANFPAQTGDVTNSAGSLSTTVVQLQGRPLASTAPTSGQIISWNGSTWLPVTAPISGINALTQDVTASGTGSQVATVVGFQGRPFASTAPTTNQVVTWNGSTWGPATPPPGGINQLTGDATAIGTGSQPITLATTGVSAGNYQLGSYCATYDAKGRATSIVLATCGGGSGHALLIQTGSAFLVQTGSVLLIQ